MEESVSSNSSMSRVAISSADPGERLSLLLNQSGLPTPVRDRFHDILSTLKNEDLLVVVEALANDPTIAEYIVADMAMKYTYGKTGEPSLIVKILQNQEAAFNQVTKQHE